MKLLLLNSINSVAAAMLENKELPFAFYIVFAVVMASVLVYNLLHGLVAEYWSGGHQTCLTCS